MRRLTQVLIAVTFPVVLVMCNVRLIMSHPWLDFEYTREGFPADPFGFTTEQRQNYGRAAVDYLIYQHDIGFLGNLRFEDGRPLFNERELVHMRDVQVLTGWAYFSAVAAGITSLLMFMFAWRRGGVHAAARAIGYGAALTIMLLAVVIVVAVIGWEFFFTGFHELFFADGTWYFLTSDTLIRLFPEQFWFDAALAIGGLTLAESTLVLALTQASFRQAATARPL